MLAFASHLTGSGNVKAWGARICRFSHVPALLPLLAALLAPATVWGDIYKWNDERGNTVISNVQPVNSGKVSGVELIAASARPGTPSPGAGSQPADPRTQQALEERVENLERQLQAQQYAQQPQGAPQPGYPGDHYPPAPPPPDPNYYSGYDPGYYPSYYYPSPLVYPLIAVPIRPLVRRPAFVNRPVFVSRPPVFAGRPPVFVSRPPVFVSQPALGGARRATFGGGSTHRGQH